MGFFTRLAEARAEAERQRLVRRAVRRAKIEATLHKTVAALAPVDKIVAALVLAVGLVAAVWIHRDQWHVVKMGDNTVFLVQQRTGDVMACGLSSSEKGMTSGCFLVGHAAAPGPGTVMPYRAAQ